MRKRRILFLCSVITVVYCLIRISFFYHLNPWDDDFTGVYLCPACYGTGLCPQFYHGDVQLIGNSGLRYFKFLNRKNVFYGNMQGSRVILKKLAHNWEISEADDQLCERAKLKPCDVVAAAKHLCDAVYNPSGDIKYMDILKAYNSSTDLARCPSERLILYILSKITFGNPTVETDDHFLPDRVAEIMYGIFVNPESVILQAFPQSDGWPFPTYRGACGRVIVAEYVGQTLLQYEDSPWVQRLDLSYQLLQMAMLLTDNSQGFSLYLTDVNMDNFAIRPDGTIFLIDAEGIIVVDRKQIQQEKKQNWNKWHVSKGEACHDCLNFSVEDLCSHDLSDHNYYAICKGLLVPRAYYSSKGLLHDIPPEVEKRTNLSAMLNECAQPASRKGRFHIVPKILQVMKSLL